MWARLCLRFPLEAESVERTLEEASVSQTMLEISGGRTNSPEGLSVDEAREWMMAMAAKQQRGEL